jgi:hypothetical protein
VPLLLLMLPRVDPARANYTEFKGAYSVIRLAVPRGGSSPERERRAERTRRRSLFGRIARLPKGVPAWCGTLRGPWPTGSMREERPCRMPVTQSVGLRITRTIL